LIGRGDKKGGGIIHAFEKVQAKIEVPLPSGELTIDEQFPSAARGYDKSTLCWVGPWDLVPGVGAFAKIELTRWR
jgi:hypothetical protein